MKYLPTIFRPGGARKEFTPGLDLPSWFHDSLKLIDKNLYIVYHPHRLMWDSIINQTTGELEDPRFCIHHEHGEEQWGFVLTDANGSPIPENAWHIWRLCVPHGWAHVVKIEDHHGKYLRLLVNRLHLQASYSDKYGASQYNRLLDQQTQEERKKEQDDKHDLFNATNEENDWLLKRAMENFESGHVAPTNPTTESIISYPGQINRSKIVRPMTDEEGGLYIPDRLK